MAWRPGVPEILIVLFIVLLLFGPGRISNIAKELGSSISAFRKGMDNENGVKPEEKASSQLETKE